MRLKRSPPPAEPGRRRPPAPSARQAGQYSYYAQGQNRTDSDQSRSRRQPIPRSKTEILQYLGHRFGAIIAVLAVVALLVSSVQVSMKPRLVIVNDTSVYRLHPDSTYEVATEQLLRSSWTNTNKITINTTAITSQLKAAFPEIADASVALPVLGQRPVAYVQLTRPSVLLVSNDGKASVLDEKGRVLAPASQVSNLDSFKLATVSDQSGLEAKVGKLALDSSAVSFISNITYQLQTAHLTYSRLVLPRESQELDVYISGQPYFIKFNMHDDATVRQQAGAAIATTRYLAKQGKVPTSYIDARLPGRAYYK